MKLMLS